MNLSMEPQTPQRDPERQNLGWWQRLVAGLPMRTALVAVCAVWLLGCVWSYQEQSDFAAAKGFVFPHLLPLVVDGFAVSMAGVAWAASLDARPAVAARLATVVAVAASSVSNGVWAWLRTGHDQVTVALGVAVPIAANLAFEVLLAELRRQVQRKRGLPPPAAVPYPRLIRLVLSPFRTVKEWRALVLELTALVPAPGEQDSARSARADELVELARDIVTSSPVPVGRRRLARELDVTEYQARQLLGQVTPDTSERDAAPPAAALAVAAASNGARDV